MPSRGATPSTARPTASARPTSPPTELVCYVSGHGFGHATRTRAWLAALRRRRGDLRIQVRSDAPAALFWPERLGLEVHEAAVDPGLVQQSGLDVDWDASLAAHEAFAAGWEQALQREAECLGSCGARLVVGDVPPLAFAAARRAGVPAIAVANFGWDWILEEPAAAEPRWAPIAARYRRAYAEAELLLRLPLAGDLSNFRSRVDVPLLVNVSTRSRSACRTALGVAARETRRLVLVSFGGLGGIPAGTVEEDRSAYLFLGPDPPAGGIRVAPSPALPHEDVIHACDAVIGKPGYGTAAEALVHGTRFLYLPREGFREQAPLVDALGRLGRARPMPREDFTAGRWRAHLDALFALPPPPPPPSAGGADAVADAVLARLG